jgi:hypothetical protein
MRCYELAAAVAAVLAHLKPKAPVSEYHRRQDIRNHARSIAARPAKAVSRFV